MLHFSVKRSRVFAKVRSMMTSQQNITAISMSEIVQTEACFQFRESIYSRINNNIITNIILNNSHQKSTRWLWFTSSRPALVQCRSISTPKKNTKKRTERRARKDKKDRKRKKKTEEERERESQVQCIQSSVCNTSGNHRRERAVGNMVEWRVIQWLNGMVCAPLPLS